MRDCTENLRAAVGARLSARVWVGWGRGDRTRERERRPARAGAEHTPSDAHANTEQLELACRQCTELYNFQARRFAHTALNEQSILLCPALSSSKTSHGNCTRWKAGAGCSATREMWGGCCCGSGPAADNPTSISSVSNLSETLHFVQFHPLLFYWFLGKHLVIKYITLNSWHNNR